MEVNFNGDTWRFVEDRCNKLLSNQLSILQQQDKSYKDLILAQGQILALKSILNLKPKDSPSATHQR